MKYRNTRTGAVILTHCKVTGGNWEPVEDSGRNASREQPPKQEGNAEETPPAETTPAETSSPPAKNPKRSSAKKGS